MALHLRHLHHRRAAILAEPLRRLVGRARLTPSALGLRWLFVLGSVFAFGGVAATLHRNGALAGDARLLQSLHRRRTPALTRAMLVATELGSVEVLTSLSSLVTLALLLRRQRRAALFFALTSAGSTLINQTLKLAFGRARPDTELHLSRTTGFAFPSGHSMASAAIYGGLAMLVHQQYPRLALLVDASCGLAVLMVGSSRAYLHVHYPSDVVTGWALGLAWPVSLHGILTREAA